MQNHLFSTMSIFTGALYVINTTQLHAQWYNRIDNIYGCIECITASVPAALIVPFNSDQEIYPFVTSHAV